MTTTEQTPFGRVLTSQLRARGLEPTVTTVGGPVLARMSDPDAPLPEYMSILAATHNLSYQEMQDIANALVPGVVPDRRPKLRRIK